MILKNKEPYKLSKQEIKTAIDVIEEIKDAFEQTEVERDNNGRMALLCKVMIDGD